MAVNNFKELKIWKLGIEVVLDIYSVTQRFPKNEMFVMAPQLRRAALSIPSNIAEGFSRNTRNEFKRFLFISLGSCSEIETQLEVARQLRYVDPRTIEEITQKLNHEQKMIKKLMQRL